MQPLVTPSGKDWYADETILVAGVLFERDVSSLFPYLNAELNRTVYLKQPPFIRFRFDDILCALHPFYLAAFPFSDRFQAESFVARLLEFINGVHERRGVIRPNHKTHNPVSVVKILKLLPKSNCGRCGYTTCVAFAAAVRTARAIPYQCPDLAAPLTEKAVYPVYDDQGNVVDRIDLDIDTTLAGKVLARQKETIEELRQRLSSFENMHANPVPKYDPPFGLELSSREMEILRLIAHGATNTEVSQLLSISPHTVKSHVIHIFNKLGVNDRTQAAVWAARQGLI
jgi:DNA-binding CsgD family transcriptional regulator/ArsR family metal-binding transcriptional regulator